MTRSCPDHVDSGVNFYREHSLYLCIAWKDQPLLHCSPSHLSTEKNRKKKHPQGDALNATIFSLGLLALRFSAVAVNPAVRVIFLRLIQGCCRSFGSGSSSEGTRTYESGDGISAPSIFSDRCLCSSRSLLCYLALSIATSAPR